MDLHFSEPFSLTAGSGCLFQSPAAEQAVFSPAGSRIGIPKTPLKVDLELPKPVCGLDTLITTPVP
jgi:hypothetical protein